MSFDAPETQNILHLLISVFLCARDVAQHLLCQSVWVYQRHYTTCTYRTSLFRCIRGASDTTLVRQRLSVCRRRYTTVTILVSFAAPEILNCTCCTSITTDSVFGLQSFHPTLYSDAFQSFSFTAFMGLSPFVRLSSQVLLTLSDYHIRFRPFCRTIFS